MRRVHLIREFAPDAYEFALSSWSWIGTDDKTPRFASCFGDMFLESPDGWWFLDTVEGTLELRWNSMDAMFTDLEGAEGRAEYLLEETLTAALGQGLQLGDDEVFAFLPPPAVTGTMSVSALAPLRFAIAANLAGRIHGELNGVQPDAGASALFAAQLAAQRAAAAPAFDTPNPQTDRWEPSAQQVGSGAYPAYRPTPEPGYVGARYDASGYEPARQEAAARRADQGGAGDESLYAAGSELDYRSGQSQAYGSGGYESGGYAAAPTGGYGAPGGRTGHDYVDSAHTADSGQFSQYIADQYNTGPMAAVDYGASAPAQPSLPRGGRSLYA